MFKYSLLKVEDDPILIKKGLDPKIIRALRKHERLILDLKDWTVLANKDLIKSIKELAAVVDKLYKFEEKDIYRGIRLHGTGQGMGLVDETHIWNKLKPGIKVGYKFDYEATDPISFSFNLKIAKSFGSIIVKSKLPAKNRLVITKELNYLMGRKLFIGKTDLEEIVIYGSQKLKCEVIELP